MLTTSPTPADRATANGPPACQMSSHTVSATSTPPIRTTRRVSPDTKYRSSSKTP